MQRDTHPKWIIYWRKDCCTLGNDTGKKPITKVSSLIISIGAWTVKILVRKIVFSPHILTYRLLFASKTCNCKRNSVVR